MPAFCRLFFSFHFYGRLACFLLICRMNCLCRIECQNVFYYFNVPMFSFTRKCRKEDVLCGDMSLLAGA